MLSAQGARDKEELRKRYAALRAFVDSDTRAGLLFKPGSALRADLDDWAAYEADSILDNDPSKLQAFEMQLTAAEKEAGRFGFEPKGELHQAGVVADMPGGAAAEAVDELAAAAERAAAEAGKKTREAIPWYAWPLGLGALVVAGYAGLEIAKAAAYNHPAARAMRAMRDEDEDDFRRGRGR